MRIVDVLAAIGPVLYVVAVLMFAMRRRVLREFRRAQAYSAETAIATEPPGFFLMRFWRRKLAEAGVLRRSSDGRQWLDPVAWRSYRAARRKRGLLIAGIVLAVLVVMLIAGTV